MKNYLMLVVLACTLSGCSILRVHKQDIQQGNVYTQADVARLHTGMSRGDVVAIMGEPVDTQLFSNNRVDYVYTFQKGYGDMQEKRVTLIFNRDRLTEIVR